MEMMEYSQSGHRAPAQLNISMAA